MLPLIRIDVLINRRLKKKSVYDPGSNISLVNFNLLKKYKIPISHYDESKFSMVSGIGNVCGLVKLNVKIMNICEDVLVFAIKSENFHYDFLIGLDLVKTFKLCQDDNLIITQNLDSYVPNQTPYSNLNYFPPFNKVNVNSNIEINFNEFINVNEFSANLDHLEINKKAALQSLIDNYSSVFAKDKYDIGTVSGHEASIKLLEHKYISRKPYRCSVEDQKEIDSQITKLLAAKLIEESTSPFAAPATLVYKRGENKKNRLCIDFTSLNKLVVPESQPFPLISDLIIKTRNCRWFTVLDINSAFWSIPLRQKDFYKTGFVTQNGHYNWRCLPFGLKTAPAIFQRILRNIIRRNNLDAFCANYIDDILIFSETFEDHLKHIEELLKTILKEGFRLKILKCNFAQNSVQYLGHIIEHNVTKPINDNVIPIKEFPIPKTKKNIRQFLGKVNFYRNYIPNVTQILEPFHNLLRKNVNFNWSDDCAKSFQQIKDYLCSEPCLAIYDPTKETIVQTDASITGIGAILKQKQEDGIYKPVAFFSKKLNEFQKRKKAIFLECLAIKEALTYWHYWLINLNFLVLSDHKPLEDLKIHSKNDEELRHMLFYLSQYNFKVKYVPGNSNSEADCLSRNPILDSSDLADDFKIVNFIEFNDITKDQKNIQHNSKSSDYRIVKRGNILYTQRNNTHKILISPDLCYKIIQKVHDKFGHIGPKQIELKMSPFYYCPNMRKIITDFCHSCEICIKNKSRIPHVFGHLSQLGPATRPFEYMSLDTVGGFGGNHSPKRYLHILVDHFSRYAFIATSKTQKASDFIKLLNSILSKGIQIGTLLTDQYSGINSNDFKLFLKCNNVKLIFTSVDCAFSNGLNERLNQTIVNRIRCRINSDDSNHRRPWSQIAEECIKDYNNTVHTSTRFSPNYLLNNIDIPIVPSQCIPQRNLDEDRKKAFENSQKIHNFNKIQFDKNRQTPNFAVGDYVFISHGNSLNRNKLDELRSGPYKILEKLSNSIYKIDSGFRKSESNNFHVSKLYPASSG